MDQVSVYTLDQYQSLVNALAKGIKKIRYSTAPGVYQEKEYATVAEMQDIKRDMEVDLLLTPGTQSRTSKIKFCKWG